MRDKIIAKNREELHEIIQLKIKVNGKSCNLNHIDVSRINDMDGMFEESRFNGDLTKWLPYSLLICKDAFKDFKALKSYWGNFDNVIDRNEAISKYLLYSELNSTLNSKENSNKKHKIYMTSITF